jgi:hypothetical protein
MAGDGTSALLRALMRPGGNPYAFVRDDEGEVSSKQKSRAILRTSSRRDLFAQQEDLFRPSPVGRDMAKQPSGNPYASLANLKDESMPAVANAGEPPAPVLGATKVAFRSECTRIFRQYIPAPEGRRLREYMRDFIRRNESRSATVRALLLRTLMKFDLSNLGAVPQFNREDESLSEQKLREIERSVGPDK